MQNNNLWHRIEWRVGEFLIKIGLIKGIISDHRWVFTRYYF